MEGCLSIVTTGQISDPTPAAEAAGRSTGAGGRTTAVPTFPASTTPSATTCSPTPGEPGGESELRRRRSERALQAVAFDSIGAGYGEAFPAKGGQLACGEWLLRELEPGAEVLDVGCGTGDPTMLQLSGGGLAVTGVDLSDGMLELARRTVRRNTTPHHSTPQHRSTPHHPTPHHVDLHRIDLYDLSTDRAAGAWGLPGLGPLGAGRFAAATAFFSLILLPLDEIPTALARIRRLLRPGGLLALGMVEADLDHVALPFLGTGLRISGYLREDLERVLVTAGFTVEEQFGLPYAPASTTLPPEEQLFLCCRRSN